MPITTNNRDIGVSTPSCRRTTRRPRRVGSAALFTTTTLVLLLLLSSSSASLSHALIIHQRDDPPIRREPHSPHVDPLKPPGSLVPGSDRPDHPLLKRNLYNFINPSSTEEEEEEEGDQDRESQRKVFRKQRAQGSKGHCEEYDWEEDLTEGGNDKFVDADSAELEDDHVPDADKVGPILVAKGTGQHVFRVQEEEHEDEDEEEDGDGMERVFWAGDDQQDYRVEEDQDDEATLGGRNWADFLAQYFRQERQRAEEEFPCLKDLIPPTDNFDEQEYEQLLFDINHGLGHLEEEGHNDDDTDEDMDEQARRDFEAVFGSGAAGHDEEYEETTMTSWMVDEWEEDLEGDMGMDELVDWFEEVHARPEKEYLLPGGKKPSDYAKVMGAGNLRHYHPHEEDLESEPKVHTSLFSPPPPPSPPVPASSSSRSSSSSPASGPSSGRMEKEDSGTLQQLFSDSWLY